MNEAAHAAVSWAEILSIVSSIATVIALGYTAYQVRQARIASSATAAALILANVKARFEVVVENRENDGLFSAVCDLLNELELSCAMYFDGQMGGNTGKLSVSFVKDILGIVERHDYLLECVQRAISKADTFECIKRFADKYKDDWKALPPIQ